MSKIWRGILSLGAAMAAFVASAASTTVEGNRLFVNDSFVFSFSGSAGAAKAKAMASVIRAASSPSAVQFTGKKKSARVTVSGTPVWIITKSIASAYGMTPSALASSFSARLRAALALPPIKLDRAFVQLGATGVAEVGLSGSGAQKATIELSQPDIASITRQRGKLVVRAKSIGQSEVVLSYGDAIKTFVVKVSPAAAQFPQQLSLAVTGAPATTATVRGVLNGALYAMTKTQADAQIRFRLPEVSSLPSGTSRAVPVRVSVSAPDCLPAEGLVYVNVRNVGVANVNESELWYCNNPETVRTYGNLFTAELAQNKSARLLYHHMNGMPNGMIIDVTAINDSDRPARLVILPGDGNPDRNPVLAGADAGEEFVRNWLLGSGDVVTIPPRSTLPIAMRRLAPNEVMSGLCQLRLLDGSPDSIQVVTMAKAPFGLDTKWALGAKTSTPWRYTGPLPISALTPKVNAFSDYVFPNPFRQEEVTYQVGGKHPFIRIGEKAIPREDKLSKLSGNFGVIYTIKAKLENPYDNPIDVDMVIEASAGYLAALFVINGEFKRTPMMLPKTETKFAKVRLEPGATRNFTILTVPLSGSAYPATITMRPVEGSVFRTGDKK